MTNAPAHPPAASRPGWALARIAMTTLAAAVGLGVIGAYPTTALAGQPGAEALVWALAVAVVGAWAGSVPVVLYLSKPPREHPAGILLGLSARFVVTIGLALAIWLAGPVSERPFLLWVGLGQFVLLGVDVVGLVGLLKQAAREAA